MLLMKLKASKIFYQLPHGDRSYSMLAVILANLKKALPISWQDHAQPCHVRHFMHHGKTAVEIDDFGNDFMVTPMI